TVRICPVDETLVRKALFDREVRVDSQQFGPELSSLDNLSQMTQNGSEPRATDIRILDQHDPFSKHKCCGFIVAEQRVRHAEVLQQLVCETRVEANGALEVGNRVTG